ncbi:MAG: hypothetical protein WKG06_13955 [Segetibacter sp.]
MKSSEPGVLLPTILRPLCSPGRTGNILSGQIKFDNLSNSENLVTPSFNNNQLQFNRAGANQQYTALVRGDDLQGTLHNLVIATPGLGGVCHRHCQQ